MLFIYTNNGDLMRKKIIFSIVSLIFIFIFLGISSYNKKQLFDKKLKEEITISIINKKYSENVITLKDCNLYKKENNKYIKAGKVFKNVNLKLEKTIITSKSKYFKIDDSNYYIYYKNITKTKNNFIKDNRYNNYLYFDENLVTNKNYSLYQDNKKVFTFNSNDTYKILIKDDSMYGVIYNNELYYINNNEVKDIYKNKNNIYDKALEIPVTVYHFLYLNNEECGEIICNFEKQVREEFNYLKDNNYFTINTKEMEYFINGKINLPKNSILITIDDGAQATKFLPILDEYRFNATLFLISSWYKVSDFKSDYLELASHTHNLHNPGVCSGEQGSPLKCMDKNSLIDDLKLSRITLNNTDTFCFPFYEYNDYAINIIKEVGFKTAYIGGDIKARIGEDNYLIPRITIHNKISLNNYIKLIT